MATRIFILLILAWCQISLYYCETSVLLTTTGRNIVHSRYSMYTRQKRYNNKDGGLWNLERIAEDGQSVLIRAAWMEQPNLPVKLPQSKREIIDVTDNDKYILLHRAVKKGNFDILNSLISKGVDLEAKSISGETALLTAIITNQKDVVAFLINKGAKLNTSDNVMYTPLHWAAEKGNVDILNLLISKGADLEAKSVFGETALLIAYLNNNKKVVDLLVKKGANVRPILRKRI